MLVGIQLGALAEGTRVHGVGKWNAILSDPRLSRVLKSRTAADLKEEWQAFQIDLKAYIMEHGCPPPALELHGHTWEWTEISACLKSHQDLARFALAKPEEPPPPPPPPQQPHQHQHQHQQQPPPPPLPPQPQNPAAEFNQEGGAQPPTHQKQKQKASRPKPTLLSPSRFSRPVSGRAGLWTTEEIAALEQGVKTYGEGNWSAILHDAKLSRIISRRTSIDLRVKWKAMKVAAMKAAQNSNRRQIIPAAPAAPQARIQELAECSWGENSESVNFEARQEPAVLPAEEERREDSAGNARPPGFKQPRCFISGHGGPWSKEEISALCDGVRMHGEGQWKRILQDPRFASVLKSRTNFDLKDKWRFFRKTKQYKAMEALREQFFSANGMAEQMQSVPPHAFMGAQMCVGMAAPGVLVPRMECDMQGFNGLAEPLEGDQSGMYIPRNGDSENTVMKESYSTAPPMNPMGAMAPPIALLHHQSSPVPNGQAPAEAGSGWKKKKNQWTDEELAALCEGVKLYGEGCWRNILNDARLSQTLKSRTNVELKDKWRFFRKSAAGVELMDRIRRRDGAGEGMVRREEGENGGGPANKMNEETQQWESAGALGMMGDGLLMDADINQDQDDSYDGADSDDDCAAGSEDKISLSGDDRTSKALTRSESDDGTVGGPPFRRKLKIMRHLGLAPPEDSAFVHTPPPWVSRS
ncbi:hypothetical protein CBR_g6627 [Chara braunii]|uniref:MYB transcription factor n=1 Tax=Chara braunii TaxID=69332 RepID=A0A388KKI0_CHABU|nr:hypothetical protein CBR_g6627 [Chara braunii]|eukprot:GBG70498.1 hypothetical protein CBR_g6627 [Chara braunii]